jgi:putative peptidoglycan binding protein/LysM domain-containing protein
MATDYIVQQGDYLAKLANQFGLPASKIWNHPNNAALKQKRPNPNVLFPGDQLHVPDREPREEPCATDQLHKFETRASKLWLRLTLEDRHHQPIANSKCILEAGNDSQNLTTDGDGKIDQLIPADLQDGSVTIRDPKTPLKDVRIALKIGYLDPIEEVSGQIARLNNLGYFAGDVDDPNQAVFLSAVEEFQCDFGLTVDGICGPDTQGKLKQVYGC